MTNAVRQQIDCEVTFTRERPPGHEFSWPKRLNGCVYRPLLRVGGENFGVGVDSGPEIPQLEVPMTVTMTLLNPNISYDVLAPGTAFIMCEGSIVVGSGRVLLRHESQNI